MKRWVNGFGACLAVLVLGTGTGLYAQDGKASAPADGETVSLDGQTPLASAKSRARRPVLKPLPPGPGGIYRVLGPLDLTRLEREKQVRLTVPALEEGAQSDLFDGNRYSAVRTTGAAPASWTAVLERPRAVEEVGVIFGGDAGYEWSLAAADTEADLRGKRGTYRVLAQRRTAPMQQSDQLRVTAPRPYRAYTLECRRVSGQGGVELAEWMLWSPQTISRVEVQCFVPEVAQGGLLPLRAVAWLDGGARQNLTTDVTWQVSPATRGRVDGFSRLEALEAGKAEVTAVFGKSRSAPLSVAIDPAGRPDWDVTFVERYPRTDAELKPGQMVQWVAHVKNYGTAQAPQVEAIWRLGGKQVRSGRLPKLERFAQTELIFTTPNDPSTPEIEVVVDPENIVLEVSEGNNALKVDPSAAPVAFWVEEGNLIHFHRHQRDLGVGSNSWEDWAQRQVSHWNRTATANGKQRWRLDRIIVVGDSSLPLTEGSPEREPDRRDRGARLRWGFRAYDPSADDRYRRTNEKDPANPFYIQDSLRLAVETVSSGPAPVPGTGTN